MLDQANGLDWLEDRKMKVDATRFALQERCRRRTGAADAAKCSSRRDRDYSEQRRKGTAETRTSLQWSRDQGTDSK